MYQPFEMAPGECGGVELQVVDRLDYLVAIRVALVVFRDEVLLPVPLPDCVQPGVCIFGFNVATNSFPNYKIDPS